MFLKNIFKKGQGLVRQEPTVALPCDPGRMRLGLVGFFASSRPAQRDVAKSFFLPDYLFMPSRRAGIPGHSMSGRRAELGEELCVRQLKDCI